MSEAGNDGRRCPKCGERLVRRAREGGLLLKTRWLRLTQDPERTVFGCPKCSSELEVRRGRLLLFTRVIPVAT